MKKIIILGAGLSGLAAATELSVENEVLVLEKNNYIGGLAASFNYKGYEIPFYYHHVFNHDSVTRSFLKRFDDSGLTWKKIKMAILVNNRSYNFTNPLALLSFNYLTFKEKIRYGLFGFYVFYVLNPDKIPQNLDAEKWLKKYAGKGITKKLFHELYAKNKFNISLSEISAKQFAHRLKAKEALGVFGYPRDGLDKFIDNMKNYIEKNKSKILINQNIQEIDLIKKQIKVNNKKIKYDLTINTIPIPEFLKIAKGLPKVYELKLSKIKYCPAVSIVIGTDKFLSNHYWLNVLKEPKLQMIMQHSWLYDNYPEKITWLLRYGGSEEDLGINDDKIFKEYTHSLKKYYPRVNIKWYKVFREKYAEPIYDKNYYLFKPDYKTPIPSLYHAGIQVSYPLIRTMNSALISGLEVAKLIKSSDS
ncbi:MAG: FAD-dependent oxidoreductase [Candidatus Nanoarchaeia archaeon]|nr:FAD-dependent oxidoreductase [Candidatus Nanoarchaeia archaeon]